MTMTSNKITVHDEDTHTFATTAGAAHCMAEPTDHVLQFDVAGRPAEVPFERGQSIIQGVSSLGHDFVAMDIKASEAGKTHRLQVIFLHRGASPEIHISTGEELSQQVLWDLACVGIAEEGQATYRLANLF